MANAPVLMARYPALMARYPALMARYPALMARDPALMACDPALMAGASAQVTPPISFQQGPKPPQDVQFGRVRLHCSTRRPPKTAPRRLREQKHGLREQEYRPG